jgi:hypothetical protein
MDIFFTTGSSHHCEELACGTLPGIFKKTPCRKTTHAVLLINSINFYIFIGLLFTQLNTEVVWYYTCKCKYRFKFKFKFKFNYNYNYNYNHSTSFAKSLPTDSHQLHHSALTYKDWKYSMYCTFQVLVAQVVFPKHVHHCSRTHPRIPTPSQPPASEVSIHLRIVSIVIGERSIS